MESDAGFFCSSCFCSQVQLLGAACDGETATESYLQSQADAWPDVWVWGMS